ncbi:phosphatidate cytidylyltransferase [Sphingomonas ginsenosidimutans]|jgi:phosphatidate cytidylyltransferase|uniref:Phosphatidate cytidylyltransferase n=2 Tax=Sphingomonas TaxID=13687 RepID=A0A2A4HT32_9SPHN|nr:phosphatidate cytidylyltransferase [Sphingomonas ginsenosidimutans]MEE2917235.1 phosphatidate cytidylyltransferase [Pseudomonadota bacterium]PCG08072.1 phosphatidate cytidylyltransferase [Sphingomonas ginsenosidimutans]
MSDSSPSPFPPTPDAALRTPSNLRLRMIASVAMIAVASVALILGDIAFWLLAVVVALFMMAEWGDLQKVPPKTKRLAQFALSVPLATMAPAWLILETHDFFTLGLVAGAAFFVAIVTRLPRLALGVAYCGLPVLALVFLRRQDDGLLYAFWAMALVWACDIGAFFAGRSIGGPKLAPRLSPNKTWAGLGGGVIAAGALGLLLWAEAGLPALLAGMSPLLAVLAQAGDLYESWLKRVAGVKDSGNVLPGHGGVLDRIDGLVPVAPVAALLVAIPQILS